MNNFIIHTVEGATRDNEFAKDLTHALLKATEEQFKIKAELLVKKIVQQNYSRLDRVFLLNLCDQEVNRTTDVNWLKAYVSHPRAEMEKRFFKDWNLTEEAINEKLKEEKTCQQKTLQSFFTLIQKLVSELEQVPAMNSVHFIKDFFHTTYGRIEENRINKGKCMAKVLYSYMSRQPIEHVYHCGGLQYKLDSRVLNLFHNLQVPGNNLVELTRKLKKRFDLINLDNFPSFLKEVLNLKDTIIHRFTRQPCKLIYINPKIKAETLEKGRGCKEDCPCCGRPCDVDHTKSATPIGKDDNCHRCDSGHQYRAFRGFKYEIYNAQLEDKYEPSLVMCESVDESQIIRHEPTGFEGPWQEFKKRFPTWDFGDHAADAKSLRIEQARNRYDKIWRIIGPHLCTENNWKYVVINTKPNSNTIDTKANHFIFLVDGSGSMGLDDEQSRWYSLKKAVLRFVQLRQNRIADRITIISFADNASVTCKNQQIKDVKDLTRINGGTSFAHAIQTLNHTLNEIKKEKLGLNNVVAFMSDGEDQYPLEQLEELKDVHGTTLKQWFTISAVAHSKTLQEINDTMNGKLIDVSADIDVGNGLMAAFVEIANIK